MHYTGKFCSKGKILIIYYFEGHTFNFILFIYFIHQWKLEIPILVYKIITETLKTELKWLKTLLIFKWCLPIVRTLQTLNIYVIVLMLFVFFSSQHIPEIFVKIIFITLQSFNVWWFCQKLIFSLFMIVISLKPPIYIKLLEKLLILLFEMLDQFPSNVAHTEHLPIYSEASVISKVYPKCFQLFCKFNTV